MFQEGSCESGLIVEPPGGPSVEQEQDAEGLGADGPL